MELPNDEMTVRDYAGVLRRRWWVIAAFVGVAVVLSLATSLAQDQVYEAEARLLVETGGGDSLFADDSELRGADATRAIQTEIEVIEGERVRTRVERRLEIDDPAEAEARAVGVTDVIVVTVRSNDPEQARDLANAYVEEYIEERRDQAVEELLAAGEQIQEKLAELQVSIDELASDDPLRSSLLAQQAAFQETLGQLQVDAGLKTGGAAVVQIAELPVDPVEPTPLRSAAIAAFIGAVLGVIVVLLAERLDDSVRTEQDVAKITTSPTLAVVPMDPPPDPRPVSISSPNDVAVEMFRGLRNNLIFLGLEQHVGLIQVTSAVAGEGKTTTAANLACVFAQAGRSVVIVDCDLRRPQLHNTFSVSRSPGFTDQMMGADDVTPHTIRVGDGATLDVLPAGAVLSNPGELFLRDRCADVLQALTARYDFVIVDSPPVLPVADAVALSRHVDAVLFVIEARSTSSGDAAEALARLGQAGAPTAGVVLNQAGRRGGTYAYRSEAMDSTSA
ncbi:capsular exopolysaccharide synthesis family protein [Ilumatobacter fluminis]|uniref:Capsular exopolysaccharide synthesis family protein n=1 Tax=Ilumatobacter fluminis TaxID=467091 RepID=A0A4R7I566_9ACTN|nr:tyrosine-protein kinase domain-containing protein [Ilumatobacter fluminis]TDT18480.1 capsular exopolysaccharide synthesis family protein [Ilumatobacter fluminis]